MQNNAKGAFRWPLSIFKVKNVAANSVKTTGREYLTVFDFYFNSHLAMSLAMFYIYQ